MKTKILWAKKVFIYTLGLFVMSTGIALSIRSGLGVSPGSSLPYVVSLVTKLELGICVVSVLSLFILCQFIILGRNFKPTRILQVLGSAVFGFFMDVANRLVDAYVPLPTIYPMALAMVAVSIVLVALGVYLYVQARVLMLPGEGVAEALAIRFSAKLSTTKIIWDSLVVLTSIALSFLFLHQLQGVREGTIVSSLLVGLVMKVFERTLNKPVHRFLGY